MAFTLPMWIIFAAMHPACCASERLSIRPRLRSPPSPHPICFDLFVIRIRKQPLCLQIQDVHTAIRMSALQDLPLGQAWSAADMLSDMATLSDMPILSDMAIFI